jgi:uncharacterized protein YkwD
MVAKGYFSHLGADGTLASERARAAGYVHPVGENLAWTRGDQKGAIDTWPASPAHCENLMRRTYDDAGVGVRQRAGGRTYWVLLLGSSSKETR